MIGISKIIGVILFTAVLVGCKKKYIVYYSPGPVQVIANNEKLYMFLEIDRLVLKGSKTYDAPRKSSVGHQQEIIIFDANGLVDRIKLQPAGNVEGVTFHPNISSVFFRKDKFYILSSESLNYKDSVFEWDNIGGRFNILSIEEGKKILPFSVAEIKRSERDRQIDSLSHEYGWKLLIKDSSIDSKTFKWNDLEFSTTVMDKNQFFEILIDVDSDINRSTVVLSYDKNIVELNAKEFKDLPRPEGGHSK